MCRGRLACFLKRNGISNANKRTSHIIIQHDVTGTQPTQQQSTHYNVCAGRRSKITITEQAAGPTLMLSRH